jgi:hypothetical protein
MEGCKQRLRKDDYAYINHEDEEFFRRQDDMACVSKHPCNIMKNILRKDKIRGLLDKFETEADLKLRNCSAKDNEKT